MMRRLLSIGFVLLAALAASQPLAAQVGGLGLRRNSVSGTLHNSITNQAPEGIKVELHILSGFVVSQVLTQQNGQFDFGPMPPNTYSLVVDLPGYERIDQSVSTSVSGANVLLELRRKGPDPNAPSGPMVSVRELSLPRKAHKAMEKGLGLLYQKSDAAGSLVQFQRAVKEYAGYYEAYAQMAIAYQQMDDPATAERMLRKSVSVSGDDYVEGYCMLAGLLNEQKRFADAETPARAAIELDANGWKGHFELARALYGLDDLAGAQTSANAAVELKPDNAETYLVLANIHSHLGNYPQLVDDLNKYLRLNPIGDQADQARQTRDQIRQVLSRTTGSAASPAPAVNP